MVFNRRFSYVELLCLIAASAFAAQDSRWPEEDEYYGWTRDVIPTTPNISDELLFNQYLKDYDYMVQYSEQVAFPEKQKERKSRLGFNVTGWHVAAQGEVGYYAVLYGRNLDTRELQTCGGAMLTPSRVLTICSCVISWIFNKDLKNKPFGRPPWAKLDKYDIWNPDIYVMAGFLEFDHDYQEHYLAFEVREVSECTATTYLYDVETLVQKKKTFQSRYAVMAVEPAILHLPADHFVPWPVVDLRYSRRPSPENFNTEIAYGWPASLLTVSTISMGAKLKNHESDKNLIIDEVTGKEFNTRNWALMMNHNLCNLTKCGEFLTPKNEFKYLRCFCPYTEVKMFPELCGSMIGSPIISHGGFVGLTNSPAADCNNNGTFFGRVLPREFIERLMLEHPELGRPPFAPNLAREPSQFHDYDFLMPFAYSLAKLSTPASRRASSCAERPSIFFLSPFLICFIFLSNKI